MTASNGGAVDATQDIVPGNVKRIAEAFRKGSGDLYWVSLDAIRIRPGFNDARHADPEYAQAVRETADSIKENGFFRHKPLKVAAAAEGFFYLSDGHTRWDAVLLANSEGAGVEAVPIVNETKGTTEVDRIFGLILDNTGRRLTPLGEGIVIKRLLGRGVQEKEIARRLGRNIITIRSALELEAAPQSIKDAVTAGDISATSAVHVMKAEGQNAVATIEAAKAEAAARGKKKVTPKVLKAVKAKKEKAAAASAVDAVGTPMSSEANAALGAAESDLNSAVASASETAAQMVDQAVDPRQQNLELDAGTSPEAEAALTAVFGADDSDALDWLSSHDQVRVTKIYEGEKVVGFNVYAHAGDDQLFGTGATLRKAVKAAQEAVATKAVEEAF